MRKPVVVALIVATVLVFSMGTALAESKPADKGDGKGEAQQAAKENTTTKGQGRQVANEVSTRVRLRTKAG